jgi:eukaryotic-like serine/threonine-protein kinase
MPAERQLQVRSALAECTVGSVISGRYEVVRVLGQGAMGVVVAARHIELDEIVAIKFIHPDMHSVPDIVSRFAREAKACARLGSEHIAKVTDVGVAPAIGPYIVMEYLEGQDLGSLLRERGALSIRRACEYVMQACEALALAHAAGIIHRDVKPDNLFLTRRGNMDIVKVLDFGISKAPLAGKVFGGELRSTETACLMGTPLYMSPEQIRATHEVDHRSDIWSLGVVLFELLTGRTAFSGETVTQVCALVLEGPAPRLVDHCRGAPAALAVVIERCLMKDPAQRFQHAADLAHALLPFAPSRARLHAERASSVLRRDSPSMVAIAGGRESGPVGATPPAPLSVVGDGVPGPSEARSVRARLARLIKGADERRVFVAGSLAVVGIALTFAVLAIASPAHSRRQQTTAPVAPAFHSTPIRIAPRAPVEVAPLARAAPPLAQPQQPPRPAPAPRVHAKQRSGAKLAKANLRPTLGIVGAAAAGPDTEPPPLAATPETPKRVAPPPRVRLLDEPTRLRRLD